MVIVDAAFVDRVEREPFRLLAEEMKLAFVIASIYAGTKTMRKRIAHRLRAGNDASEADQMVLEKLQQKQQPLSSQELSFNIKFVNEGKSLSEDQGGWSKVVSIIESQRVLHGESNSVN